MDRRRTLRDADDLVCSAAATRRVTVVREGFDSPIGQTNDGYRNKRVDPLQVISDAERLSGAVSREGAIGRLCRFLPRSDSPAIHRIRTGQFPDSPLQQVRTQA